METTKLEEMRDILLKIVSLYLEILKGTPKLEDAKRMKVNAGNILIKHIEIFGEDFIIAQGIRIERGFKEYEKSQLHIVG